MTANQNPLKIEHLHFLKDGVRFIQESEAGFFDLGSQLTLGKLNSMCDEEFSWAYLYELPFKHNAFLIFSAYGFLPAILSSVNSGVEVNQAIIDHVTLIQKNPDSFVDGLFNVEKDPATIEDLRNLRVGGLFSLSDILALTHAMWSQVAALRKHGKTLSELVDDVRRGKDESFWLALHIDPTVISCSVFSRRMSIAYVQNDQGFFKLLSNAVGIKWKKKKVELDPLRVLLHACNEAKMLDSLSLDEKDKLFIKELGVYSDDGEDPARSLARFIDRWKKSI